MRNKDLLVSLYCMDGLLKVFIKSLVEGFGFFIWQNNGNISYPYSYTPKSLFEDKENINNNFIAVLNRFKKMENSNGNSK